MKQSDSENKDQQRNLSATEAGEGETDSVLVSTLEQLAFKLHDFANRLLGYLR